MTLSRAGDSIQEEIHARRIFGGLAYIRVWREAAGAKTVIDLDEEALTLAMARYGTRVKKEAVNRALREAAGRHEQETDDLADWFQEVGRRLGEADPRTNAWRR